MLKAMNVSPAMHGGVVDGPNAFRSYPMQRLLRVADAKATEDAKVLTIEYGGRRTDVHLEWRWTWAGSRLR
jgi:hypothetical protein